MKKAIFLFGLFSFLGAAYADSPANKNYLTKDIAKSDAPKTYEPVLTQDTLIRNVYRKFHGRIGFMFRLNALKWSALQHS